MGRHVRGRLAIPNAPTSLDSWSEGSQRNSSETGSPHSGRLHKPKQNPQVEGNRFDCIVADIQDQEEEPICEAKRDVM
jgi:hypothetical protein